MQNRVQGAWGSASHQQRVQQQQQRLATQQEAQSQPQPQPTTQTPIQNTTCAVTATSTPTAKVTYQVQYRQSPSQQQPQPQPQQQQQQRSGKGRGRSANKTTSVSSSTYGRPIRRQKMDFFMNVGDLREDLRLIFPNGVYTLDLIRYGKRFATTRSFPLGEPGDIVTLYNSANPRVQEVNIRILGAERLNLRTAEDFRAWSLKEGWSEHHIAKNAHLQTEWQTSYELIGPPAPVPSCNSGNVIPQQHMDLPGQQTNCTSTTATSCGKRR
ncbi:hypothetical protein Pelo_3069 [Pelomyxa schiedti]|nr:hypothetical protein Pelo_3069 [Pelomyxa schiedti]